MQSSQSSATIALRAIIMLAFIIAIPLAAINGPSLPERAKKMLDKVWPAIASAISTTTSNVLPETPAYDAKSQNSPSVPGQNSGGMSNAPGLFSANTQPNPLPRRMPGGSTEQFGAPASNVVPAAYQGAVDQQGHSPDFNSGGQSDTNRFMAMQDRLRQLGATYYLLETWGTQRQFYRFYCQMAVGGNSNYTRYFEAMDANPLEAMADVLRQVVTWRGNSDAIR